MPQDGRGIIRPKSSGAGGTGSGRPETAAHTGDFDEIRLQWAATQNRPRRNISTSSPKNTRYRPSFHESDACRFPSA